MINNNVKMIITLNENNSDAMVSIQQDGRTDQKCVSAEDLVSALANQQTFSTGLVPSGTRFFKGHKKSYVITIESPAKVRRFLLYSNTKSREQGDGYRPREIGIPFPNCLFTFAVSNGKIQQTWVHSLSGKLSSEKDILYYFPFGNTFYDSRVCWGKVMLPVIKSPSDLIGVIALFYDAPFNGDLMTSDRFNLCDVKDFWGLISYLEDKMNFSSEWLGKTTLSFKNFIDTCHVY